MNREKTEKIKERQMELDRKRRELLKMLGISGGFLALETLIRCEGKAPTPPTTTQGKWIPPQAVQDIYPLSYTEELVPTTCWIGKQDCSMLARVLTQKVKINGKEREIRRVVRFYGLMSEDGKYYNPRNKGTLCPKGVGQISALYDYNRVKAPLKRVNKKGEQGRFVEISWDEALSEIAKRLQKTKQNGEYVLWQKGRSKAKKFYDRAFVNALKSYLDGRVYKVGHGAYCSDTGYRACEYTIGRHGVLNPDWKYTNYVINIGAGLTTSGGNKLCFITWPQMMVEAKKRGAKIVHIDPYERPAGPHADEWIPIKPSTDLAFFLGIANYLVTNGYVDREYLRKYTNAPFLVVKTRNSKDNDDIDGLFARVVEVDENGEPTSKKELVMDSDGRVKPYDEASKPELEGEFDVPENLSIKVITHNGEIIDVPSDAKLKPAYQVLKEQLRDYTPDWADKVCGLPPMTTARIARELWENSGIKEGKTITIDGETLPLRPVSFMMYHVTQNELGFQLTRAVLIVALLLGSIHVPGGTISEWGKTSMHKNFKKFEELKVKEPPYDYTLSGSKFFPITTPNPSFLSRVLIDPTRYEVDESKLPKVVFVHMYNHAVSAADIPQNIKGWSKLDFVVVLTPWYDETASLFADIVLPAATIEKYEGPMSGSIPYEKTETLRVPPIPPLFQSKGEIDIYLDIAEKTGFLAQYISEINDELGINLPTNRKPTSREIFDAWAKKQGLSGVDYFERWDGEKGGVLPPSQIKAEKIYSIMKDYFGEKLRVYGENLLKIQRQQKELGADEIYWRDYTPLPEWRKPTMEGSPSEYDLYLITGKKIEHKQSRSSFIALLQEIAPEQELLLNPLTAMRKGIKDGDIVYVESINPLTGETRRAKVKVKLTHAIRPDTVYMAHHYGLWTHPNTEGQGPSPNLIYFSSEGFVSQTMDQSFQVKVRVWKEVI